MKATTNTKKKKEASWGYSSQTYQVQKAEEGLKLTSLRGGDDEAVP
jgi:hypothetical protein